MSDVSGGKSGKGGRATMGEGSWIVAFAVRAGVEVREAIIAEDCGVRAVGGAAAAAAAEEWWWTDGRGVCWRSVVGGLAVAVA